MLCALWWSFHVIGNVKYESWMILRQRTKKIRKSYHKSCIMNTLLEKSWNCCKILARCLPETSKRMHYSGRSLTRFCKNRSILTSFFQDFIVSFKILARLALIVQFFLSHKTQQIFCRDFFRSLRKWSKNLTVDSEPSVPRRLRKRQEWYYSKVWEKK